MKSGLTNVHSIYYSLCMRINAALMFLLKIYVPGPLPIALLLRNYLSSVVFLDYCHLVNLVSAGTGSISSFFFNNEGHS